MSFSLRDLSVLNYANGYTHWHYKSSSDSFEQTTARGYFAPASDLVADGDLVTISCIEDKKVGVRGIFSAELVELS